MDDDLAEMDHDTLIQEAKRLRASIREHSDSSGHALCWRHPQLWGLLQEPIPADLAVPTWPKFIRGCVAYRAALDRELPNARVHDREYGEG